MNKRALIVMSVFAVVSTGLFSPVYAQEKTRAEVRQELIQAQHDGLNLVTDTSYPDVNPIFAQQAARQRPQQENANAVGAQPMGSSAAGSRIEQHDAMTPCVGPISYCTLYFGS